MQTALDRFPALRNPFAGEPIPKFALLVELASCATQLDVNLDAMLTRFLEEYFEKGEITNAIVGRGTELWELRHALSEGARALGKVIGFDVSVRRADVMRFRRAASAIVSARYPHLLVVDFGHVGDGGLHFNLVWPQDCGLPWSDAAVERVRKDIYELVVERFHGSYSAEHGIGPHNIGYYQKYTAAPTSRLAGRLQRALDPADIGATVRLGKLEEQVIHT